MSFRCTLEMDPTRRGRPLGREEHSGIVALMRIPRVMPPQRPAPTTSAEVGKVMRAPHHPRPLGGEMGLRAGDRPDRPGE
jgi:hypothetical protein